MYGIDAVHGHNNVYGATIFPHNIGLGATRWINHTHINHYLQNCLLWHLCNWVSVDFASSTVEEFAALIFLTV
jgi:hypothetical protein